MWCKSMRWECGKYSTIEGWHSVDDTDSKPVRRRRGSLIVILSYYDAIMSSDTSHRSG